MQYRICRFKKISDHPCRDFHYKCWYTELTQNDKTYNEIIFCEVTYEDDMHDMHNIPVDTPKSAIPPNPVFFQNLTHNSKIREIIGNL